MEIVEGGAWGEEIAGKPNFMQEECLKLQLAGENYMAI